MELIIPGKPIHKNRPRFARRGNFVITYNDQRAKEDKFLLLVREQFKQPPFMGPIRLSCGFYMPIPESTSKKKRQAMICEVIRPEKKPDLSNLIKFVEDCLNETVWGDDKQIVSYGAMEKFYSEEPRTVIRIERLPAFIQEISHPSVKRIERDGLSDMGRGD